MTPEVQQYINQQRTAGVSDSQIRQSLTTQGWTQADLDQAFGVAPNTAPQASLSNNTKKIIWAIIIIFVLLPLLSYVWFRIANNSHDQEQDAYNLISEQIKQSTLKNKTDPYAIKNLADAQAFKLCGDWPGDYPEKASLIKSSQLGPEFELPTDFRVYPGAVKIAEDAIVYYFCTNDDPDKIISFYLSDQTPWKVEQIARGREFYPKINVGSSPQILIATKDSSTKSKGTQFATPNVTMLIFRDANQTVLAFIPNW